MKRRGTALLIAGTIGLLAGCSTQRPFATVESVPCPVDDSGREMGPMPLAVGDSVGRAVYMSRPALVARGLVPTEQTFADGSMSSPPPGE